MLLTNIDHWDLFTISEERYLLFPRFKKDYSISIKDLYYHKGRNYILQLRNNTENIKNIRFNVIPYFKHLRNSHYMFMPCWNLYSHRPITSHQLTLEITGISFLEDLFCKFIDLGINTTPLINLYPSGFCDGIRIDRSTIIGKRFDDLCDFGAAKDAPFNFLKSFVEYDRGQIAALSKGVSSQDLDTAWNVDTLQAGTRIKGFFSEGCQLARQFHGRKRTATIKGLVSDVGNFVGNRHGC